jgi:hypothetical protein
MIDIVTVAFESELKVLRLQARSLALFVKNVDNIVVVVNQDEACRIDTRWWGIHQHKVTVMHRNLFSHSWSPNGWVSQQALKLLAVSQCASEWAVILDAKTIFVRDFELNEIRPVVGALGICPVFEPSRNIANALFGIDLQQQLGPGGVPFVMNTQQARDMISWIEHHTGQSFANWFQQQGRLTEFILYSAWIQYSTGSLDTIYNTETINVIPVNICHSEVTQFEQKLSNMPAATTVSIHRNAWTQFTDDQQKQYMDFLASRGIA